MAKFYGCVGFRITEETSPGVWLPRIKKRMYYGDVQRIIRRYEDNNTVNSDVVLSNVISIVADPFANENIYAMLYIQYMGVKWKISNVEVQYPRLILTLGGMYDGETEDRVTENS